MGAGYRICSSPLKAQRNINPFEHFYVICLFYSVTYINCVVVRVQPFCCHFAETLRTHMATPNALMVS
jgi:hypothetical protein